MHHRFHMNTIERMAPLFDLDVNGLEIIARTVIVYAALLVALRIAGKRLLG
jgi:hypothetical protein